MLAVPKQRLFFNDNGCQYSLHQDVYQRYLPGCGVGINCF